VPDTGVLTVSEPDDDSVDLEVTRYNEKPSHVEAKGFCPTSIVTFRVGGVVVGAVLAGADGTAKFDVPASTLPDTPGDYQVQATSVANDDPACDLSETAKFVVPTVRSGSSGSSGGATASDDGGSKPLVVNGQPNPELFGDGKPLSPSNSDRLIKLIGALTAVSLLVLGVIIVRRRRNFQDGVRSPFSTNTFS
jgi:hypothetical protein